MQNRQSEKKAADDSQMIATKQNLSMNQYARYVASGSASLISHVMIHPLDTAVRRRQVQGGKMTNLQDLNNALFPGHEKLSMTQKFSSLMKGFWSSGVYRVLTQTIKFGIQGDACAWITQQTGGYLGEKLGKQKGEIATRALAGGLVDLGITTVTYPMDTIKIKRQNFIATPIPTLIRTEGLGLFNGLFFMVMRNVPGSAALFSVSYAITSFGLDNPKEASSYQHIMGSLFGSIAAAIVTNPQDRMKTCSQTLSNVSGVSAMSMFKSTLKTEGWWGLLTNGLILRSSQLILKLGIPMSLFAFIENAMMQQAKPEPVNEKPTIRRSL